MIKFGSADWPNSWKFDENPYFVGYIFETDMNDIEAEEVERAMKNRVIVVHNLGETPPLHGNILRN